MEGVCLMDCVVKLGGSAITHKDALETPKLEEIQRAACIIHKAHSLGQTMLVIHGAGSFGHQMASQYEVHKGYKHLENNSHKKVKDGFTFTRLSVCKLNQLVTRIFVEAGIPAVSLSPCGVWQTDCGSVVTDGTEIINSLLKEGFIPILHGDCVIDQTKGSHILSGDTIIQVVCKKLNPKRVVFLSDVPGIFDRPPNQSGASLVPEILVTPDGNINIPIKTNLLCHDVTGGMQLKLSSAAQIVKDSKGASQVFICDISSQAAEKSVLQGEVEGKIGTFVKYSEQNI